MVAENKKKINPSFKEKRDDMNFVPVEPLDLLVLELREEIGKKERHHEQEIICVSDNLRQVTLMLTIGALIGGFILGAVFL